MNNELLLLSGNDIPFIEGGLTIHQPRLKEIAYIGERALFSGCELLKFSKNSLTSEDKNRLSNQGDFQVLMTIMNDKSNKEVRQSISYALMVLDLIFPTYSFDIQSDIIYFKDKETDMLRGSLNERNFSAFKEILIEMFCLKESGEKEYNPAGKLSQKIADKFKKAHQKLAKMRGDKAQKVAIYSKYISILSVGQQKDINDLMNYTVYQLFDEFSRFRLKSAHDVYFQARLAGAKDMKEPEDWMKDIHEENSGDEIINF